MLRPLVPYAAALPPSSQARLRSLTANGEHGAALRLLARRVVSVTDDAGVPDASATALTLATSVFNDDRAALELAVLANTLAARAGLIGVPAALGSLGLVGVSAWALSSLLKRSGLRWHDAFDRFEQLHEGDPLSHQDKEIRR